MKLRLVVYRTAKGQLICRMYRKRVWMFVARGAINMRQTLPKRRGL